MTPGIWIPLAAPVAQSRGVKPSLIFDLDGTLVDSLPGIAASLNRTLDAHGLPGHSNAMVRSFVGDGLATLIQRAAGSHDPALLDSLIRCYRADYDASWSAGTRPYPGIVHLLGELARDGHKLAVLSNKTHEFTVNMVRAIFPSVHFSKVLGLREGMRPKPAPGGALELLAALGDPPSQCLLIGDSVMDIDTAANAGMKCIAVTWGYHDRPHLAAANPWKMVETVDALARTIGNGQNVES